MRLARPPGRQILSPSIIVAFVIASAALDSPHHGAPVQAASPEYTAPGCAVALHAFPTPVF
jgi:hypothetical protein